VDAPRCLEANEDRLALVLLELVVVTHGGGSIAWARIPNTELA
jgi:hypothetical protein